MASYEFQKAEAQRLQQETASGDQSTDDIGLCMDSASVSVKREISDNAAEELSFHSNAAHSPTTVHNSLFSSPMFRFSSAPSGNDSYPPSLNSPTVIPSPLVKEVPAGTLSNRSFFPLPGM